LKAILQSDFSKSSVDKDARIVRGVRVIENNRSVTYKGQDGKAKSFTTNDALLKGLLSYAGNSIPSHLSHDWTESGKDPLHARCGALKDFTLTDEVLLADFHAMPGENGDKALWLAENDPKNAALSAIFDYNPVSSGDKTFAVPLNFQAADLVAKGAACSAFLSQLQTETDMTKEEIQAIVADSIKAALADFKPATLSKDEVAEIVKASLSEHKPSLSEDELKELAVKAEASFTAKLGAGPLQFNLDANKKANTYEAKLAEYEKNAPNPATAAARLMKDHPELAESRAQHLAATRARLTHAA